MADSEEQQVSSTSTLLHEEELNHYEADPHPNPKQDLFTVDDIVDLVGGAQDALERHIAEDSAPKEFTESSLPSLDDPVTVPEPEPVSSSVPVATEPEPVPAAPVLEEPEPKQEAKEAIPDSSTAASVPEPPVHAQDPPVVTPKAEPESAKVVPEPEAAPKPEPVPERGTLPPAEPRKEAPAPAEAEERPAVTEEPAAPASCELPGSKIMINNVFPLNMFKINDPASKSRYGRFCDYLRVNGILSSSFLGSVSIWGVSGQKRSGKEIFESMNSFIDLTNFVRRFKWNKV